MHLKLVTPSKIYADQTVDLVILPGAMGQMTILPGHAMFVSELSAGKMHYKRTDNEGKERWTTYTIGKGFAEVQKDSVIVLTNLVD